MLLTVIVKNDSKVTVQKKTTKSKGRNITRLLIVAMKFCDIIHFYICLHLFVFLFICINLSPTSPVDLLLVFEGYNKAFLLFFFPYSFNFLNFFHYFFLIFTLNFLVSVLSVASTVSIFSECSYYSIVTVC